MPNSLLKNSYMLWLYVVTWHPEIAEWAELVPRRLWCEGERS
jgi:hypothetical protein